jgi:hypothetical protein
MGALTDIVRPVAWFRNQSWRPTVGERDLKHLYQCRAVEKVDGF